MDVGSSVPPSQRNVVLSHKRSKAPNMTSAFIASPLCLLVNLKAFDILQWHTKVPLAKGAGAWSWDDFEKKFEGRRRRLHWQSGGLSDFAENRSVMRCSEFELTFCLRDLHHAADSERKHISPIHGHFLHPTCLKRSHRTCLLLGSYQLHARSPAPYICTSQIHI